MRIFKTLILMLAVVSFGNGALAEPNLSGAYRGLLNGSDAIDLLIRPLPGRDGSYIALMIQDDVKVVPYLVDSVDGQNFGMIPLRVTGDGEVGTTNDNPSLILSVDTVYGNGRPRFTINLANSNNTFGFLGSFDFTGKGSCDYEWSDLLPGRYRSERWSDEMASVSAMSADFQSSTSFQFGAAGLKGNYVIRNFLPGLYFVKGVSLKNTGLETESAPVKMVFFLRKKRFIGKNAQVMVLTDPYAGSGFRSLTLY